MPAPGPWSSCTAAQFPRTAAELRTLPGVGEYTAAAVAAIAFGEAATPVDGNIERVMARLHAVETPLPAAKPELRAAGGNADAQAAAGRPRAGADGPRRHHLHAAQSVVPALPAARRTARRGPRALRPVCRPAGQKPEKPLRRGHAFVLWSEDGHLLLRRRPETGLLAGMMEVPSTDWLAADTAAAQAGSARSGAGARGLVARAGLHHARVHAFPPGDRRACAPWCRAIRR